MGEGAAGAGMHQMCTQGRQLLQGLPWANACCGRAPLEVFVKRKDTACVAAGRHALRRPRPLG